MYQRLLLILIPLSFVLHAIDADPRIVFVVSLSAIVPLVEVMGVATERLSKHLGSVVGGLLNSTLSNAPELIIGIVALRNGLGRIVKASLTGSIMVNLLVGLGCALVIGTLKHGVHSFDRRQFRSSGLMLVMCGFCFIVPAVFRIGTPQGTRDLSLELSAILLVIYVGNVLITLLGSRHYAEDATPIVDDRKESYSASRSLAVLGLSGAMLAFISEFATEALIPATRVMGFSDTFSGIVLLGGVGGIGEVLTAVRFARQGKQELVLAATVGSTIQMVLFVAPLLVFTGLFLGEQMNLSFSMFEVVSIVLTIIIAREVINAGKATWMEGFILLATYLILAIGFYHLPDAVIAQDRTAAEGSALPALKVDILNQPDG
ncbi:MAG: calcium/proton exchanger [Planctomycetaceae bacterium]|jgi:Ca2+:H+ antiporter|nr:calcium/proton exchanger [Planctomycetaceae bacterium]MBT4886995.1 calcium/proton exchanger [Planctomycetaceae bacterium]MBT6055245.1 calcium/proton exchanger [Planctomycetaceae bacterium]MBT6458617.1 calcium/proton exchanger [Planctomycetaceae bacterium]MBT6643697.1 calcium/proton exchanger [Planctomycetaceae bacterium]